LALSMPDELKVDGTRTKHLLKRTAARRIPEDCIYRKKQGFTVPMNEWLRTGAKPLLERYLSHQALSHRGVFDVAAAERMKADHLTGARDHAHVLWSMLVFEAWAQRWVDRR
jgi:asparagine synthase (glutamine-hydrolysing)